ncbi:MAG: hypothetical protein J0H49_31805 [Acidobacteria bacterium]|nr:hypothetical protein [Acidobacteriota bacterium]
MKPSICGLFVVVLLAACSSAPQAPAPAVEQKAAASTSWASFQAEFRKAVNARDAARLRPLMSEKFQYTFGDGIPTPDHAFQFWERAEIKGWDALQEIAGQEAIDFTPPPQWGLQGKVKLAPPEAAKDGYRKWRAAFEQQPDGSWRFVSFLNGD